METLVYEDKRERHFKFRNMNLIFGLCLLLIPFFVFTFVNVKWSFKSKEIQ